jgi:putative aminopeptidase FrvX
MYESELTKFMREFLKQHPEEVESQRKGRAIWWDKRPDERGRVASMQHTPKAGGNEGTFKAPEEKE